MDYGRFVEGFGFFFPLVGEVTYALAWEQTNELEADSDGSQMLEEFKSKHLISWIFLWLFVSNVCVLYLEYWGAVLTFGLFFPFFNLSAVWDKDLHCLQRVFSASACRECDNHSWTEVGAHGNAVYVGKVVHKSQSNLPSQTKSCQLAKMQQLWIRWDGFKWKSWVRSFQSSSWIRVFLGSVAGSSDLGAFCCVKLTEDML